MYLVFAHRHRSPPRCRSQQAPQLPSLKRDLHCWCFLQVTPFAPSLSSYSATVCKFPISYLSLFRFTPFYLKP
ncbi:hypothetical protein RIF29_34097 [Crotalaria pallida]|uniref:Uncharacterized protein n=1 Tax=Crotalaria pallida TaxID=3830 RepID=A0AAN9HTD3_CROPI